MYTVEQDWKVWRVVVERDGTQKAVCLHESDARAIADALNMAEALGEVREAHGENAKRCNFARCGCDYCNALAALKGGAA